jgi:hypothetical protein
MSFNTKQEANITVEFSQASKAEPGTSIRDSQQLRCSLSSAKYTSYVGFLLETLWAEPHSGIVRLSQNNTATSSMLCKPP